MNLKKVAVSLALAAVIGASADSCVGADAILMPSSMGYWNGGVYDCYYIESVDEVAAYENAGLCNAYSDPVLMPDSFENEYWGYFSSPTYYNRYMPVRYRYSYTHITISHTTTYYHSSNYAHRVSYSTRRH